jgi:hypothetical protein
MSVGRTSSTDRPDLAWDANCCRTIRSSKVLARSVRRSGPEVTGCRSRAGASASTAEPETFELDDTRKLGPTGFRLLLSPN